MCIGHLEIFCEESSGLFPIFKLIIIFLKISNSLFFLIAYFKNRFI